MSAPPEAIQAPEQRRKTGEESGSSVLFRRETEREKAPTATQPACFPDLHLDSTVAGIAVGKEQYDLKPYYYLPVCEVEDVTFRQEVMRALDDSPTLFGNIERFAALMETMRRYLAQSDNLRNALQKKRWFLDAAACYCAAVVQLSHDLADAGITASGLSRFSRDLDRYLSSAAFQTLAGETEQLNNGLRAIRYSVLIDSLRVQVRPCRDERDYGAEVTETFRPFRQDEEGENTKSKRSGSAELGTVEASILECVAKLNPETFGELDRYVMAHENFADPTVVVFDREIQFYVAYLEYLAPFRKVGLNFCYPRVVKNSKDVFDEEGFDLALAAALLERDSVPVCNDFYLKGKERIIVVSGPNQGGKTTFSRSFAQLHYLASLGCPVPGTRAQLFLADAILTHFEKGETGLDGRGKLEDDLFRIQAILERATPDSIVILNEIFDSTTVRDARLLSHKIMDKIARLDLLCVWVSFLDELASANEKTVSMVGAVVPENPTQRTYRITRQTPNGLAYALSIAEKYGLTSARLKDRLRS
ncbi:MAG: MutS-related protein [Gammaproteobacteria bacterium]